MILSAKLNPLLAYLLKRKDINFVENGLPVLGLWVASVLVIVAMYFNAIGSLLLFFIPICSLVYLPTIFIPIAVAYVSATSSSRLVKSQSYELLVLTNISSETILWSYVIATLFRLRSSLTIFIGFIPITLMATSLGWALWASGFDSSCVTTPIGNTYCENLAGSIELPEPAKLARGLQNGALMIGLAIGMIGVNLLIAVGGVTLGFWQKDRLAALLSAVILGCIVSVLTGIVIVPEIALRALIEGLPNSPIFLAVLFLIALVPYLLSFGLVRLTSHLVRRIP